MSDVQMTHSTDCWRRHHECAKRAVEELARERDALRAESERLRDELADWQNAMLRKFDAGAAGSTDLYTWITCLSAENERLRAECRGKLGL